MMLQNNWHAKDISEIFTWLKSSPNGLSAAEAELRIKTNGPNELELFKRPSALMRFFKQFHNILIYVLIISAIATAFLGHIVDTGVIIGVVVINAIFGFIQEGKAQAAMEAIRDMLAPNANVIRDEVRLEIPTKLLVVGDVVLIKSGDKVPADLRLIETKNLQIQEAILTGESNVAEKSTIITPIDAKLGDRINMAYSGTSVACGRGTGIVVATAINTEIGKISTLLKNTPSITTPLLRQINTMGQWLTLAITLLAIVTFAVGIWYWHNPIEQMFIAAVGLAVAAIPEGLPATITIILAIGVARMAKNNAIIRHLPAVETMGAVTTICTDKTGTLTRNEQVVEHIVTIQSHYNITESDLLAAVRAHEDLLLAINAAILCNDAEFSKLQNNEVSIYGNPVDKALLFLSTITKIDAQFLQNSYPRSDLIPYESEHKFMATLHHDHNDIHKQGIAYVKGAPERILSMCSLETNHQYWQEKITALARQGYRVIAIASKKFTTEKQTLSFNDIEHELSLLAIFGLIDAPRLEVAESISQCHAAGIRVKMITGDHAETALTTATQVGINSEYGALTGGDIDNLNDTELAEKIKNINIFARTSPQHKFRLVQALQTNGELVAMTGDGVNDAPALRKADIGIAMGKKGAEIAKESAAMVLADDNFVTITHAIKEGRVVYDNLIKLILLVLPTNIAEALIIVMAILFGLALPITPVQILWVNMITSVTLGIALGFEPAEADIMQKPPRPTNQPILSLFVIWRVSFVSALLVCSVFGLFIFLRRVGGVDLETARTAAINMIVLGEIVYLINCRKIYNSACNIKGLIENKIALIAIVATLVLQLLLTYVPIMQHFFGTKPISAWHWVYIAIMAIILFALVELEKAVMRFRATKFIGIKK